MPVPEQFGPIVSSLTNSASSLSSAASTIVANPPGLPAGAISAEDATDLQTALQGGADSVATETGAVTSALTPPAQ